VVAGLGLDGQPEAVGRRMDETGTVRSASGATLARIRVPDFGGGLDHVLAIRRSRLPDLLLAVVGADGVGLDGPAPQRPVTSRAKVSKALT
jgi:hypothetical protein